MESGITKPRRRLFNKELGALFLLVASWSAGGEIIWKILPFQLILLGIPVAALGILQSVNILANLVTEIPSGILVDRRGRKPAIVWGFVAMGVFITVLAISRNIFLLGASIFLVSIADSVFLRGGSVRFFEAASSSAKGRGSALFSVGIGVGGFVGLALAGLFASLGYDVIYITLGLVTLAVGLFSAPFLSDVPRVEDRRKQTTTVVSTLKKLFSFMHDFRLIRDKRFLMYSVFVQAFMSLSAGAAWVFIPALGLFAGLDPPQILLLLALVQVASAIASFAGGWASDKLNKRLFFIARPVTAIATYAVLAAATTPLLFTAAIFVSVATAFVGPGSSAFFISRFSETERGKAGSINTFFTSAVGVGAPLLGALLWTISPSGLYFFATLAVIPAVLASWIAVRE